MTFEFKPGDKIHLPNDGDRRYIEVKMVDAWGSGIFFGIEHKGDWSSPTWGQADGRWERYVEPVVYPEMWWAIDAYSATSVCFGLAEAAARKATLGHDCIGILHLRPDGSTEMLAP